MAVDKSRFPKEVLKTYADAALRPGALTAMINYYRALLRHRDRRSTLGDARIETPTLMIWGEEDAPRSTSALHRRDRGLGAELHAYAGCRAFRTGSNRRRPKRSTRFWETGSTA